MAWFNHQADKFCTSSFRAFNFRLHDWAGLPPVSSHVANLHFQPVDGEGMAENTRATGVLISGLTTPFIIGRGPTCVVVFT